jgi:hypothetical protein
MRLLNHIVLAFTAICLLLPGRAAAQQIQEVTFDDSDMALDLSEAKSFQKYPTYEHYLQMMQDYDSDFPEICRLDTFGTTEVGRLLLALKISDQVEVDEAEASFLYTSTMHGDEIVGYVLLLRLADSLLSGYGIDPEVTSLVDQVQIWINPLANPDGCFSRDNNLSLRQATRENVNGIDLNRNFPDPGNSEADNTTGRAIETRYMMEFLREHHFSLSANIHSGTEVVNYPWDYTATLHADDDWYRFISREYADEAMAVDPDYMWGWPDDGITNGWQWYEARGTRQDYVNYYLGGREVTLELSTEYLLASDQLEHFWNINVRSLFNYMAQCMYGIRGTVSDKDSGDPLHARIEIIDHDSTYSAVYSSAGHGDFYRLIKEGVYDLAITANGYFGDTIFGVNVTDYQATLLNVNLESWPLTVPNSETPELRLYPNPASGILHVTPANLPPGELKLTILSMDGKVHLTKTLLWQEGSVELDIEALESGFYLVQASIHSQRMTLRLLVIAP